MVAPQKAVFVVAALQEVKLAVALQNRFHSVALQKALQLLAAQILAAVALVVVFLSGQIIFNNKVGGCDINVLTGVVPAYSSRGYITLLSEQNFLQSGVLVLLLLLGVSIKLPSCGT